MHFVLGWEATASPPSTGGIVCDQKETFEFRGERVFRYFQFPKERFVALVRLFVHRCSQLTIIYDSDRPRSIVMDIVITQPVAFSQPRAERPSYCSGSPLALEIFLSMNSLFALFCTPLLTRVCTAMIRYGMKSTDINSTVPRLDCTRICFR